MRNYHHKHDSARQLVAIQVTSANAGDIAEWCGGREIEGSAAIEVPTQGGASSVIASEGDYVVLDSDHVFHVRSEQIFESKYARSDTQDEELDFSHVEALPVEEDTDYRWVADEKGFIPLNPDELSGETEDEDRLQ